MRSRRGGCVGTHRSHHPARQSLTPAPLPSGEGRLEIPFPWMGEGHGMGAGGHPSSGRRGVHFVRRSQPDLPITAIFSVLRYDAIHILIAFGNR